jgi:hypothetical protein
MSRNGVQSLVQLVTECKNIFRLKLGGASHAVHKLQRSALKMSVFSYCMELAIEELNYWTDLMTRWGVGWIAGSENKAHGKVASLFVQPYISQPDYDTADIPSKK